MKFLDALIEEVVKCELICVNCHRLKTSQSWQSYKSEPGSVAQSVNPQKEENTHGDDP